MIAEALAGIALVKSAVEGIKSAINTANDISDIASHIDNLFEGEKQIQKKRSKKSSVSLGDQFGIKSVAQEVIDARLAQEKMQEMKQLVDMRFGHGTWQGIVDERARRIQEAKEVAAKRRREQIQKHNELMETLKIVMVVGVVVVVTLMSLIGIFMTR
jgi:Fe2+ transport system protein B